MRSKEKERGTTLREFYGGIFIDKETLLASGIEYPIKLEYYKTTREESSKIARENENKYGIEIVKTEYREGNVRVETKEINNIANNIKDQEKILTLLRDNEVTPIGVEDVLEDLLKV